YPGPRTLPCAPSVRRIWGCRDTSAATDDRYPGESWTSFLPVSGTYLGPSLVDFLLQLVAWKHADGPAPVLESAWNLFTPTELRDCLLQRGNSLFQRGLSGRHDSSLLTYQSRFTSASRAHFSPADCQAQYTAYPVTSVPATPAMRRCSGPAAV